MDKLNGELSKEDAKNWIYRVVGRRGEALGEGEERTGEPGCGEIGRQGEGRKRSQNINNSKVFNILYSNAQSLINKIDELKLNVKVGPTGLKVVVSF